MLNIGLVLLLGLFSIAMNDTEIPKNESQSRILREPDLKTFADLIVAADLSDLFEGTGPFTAFVPTNQAFEKWGKGKLDELKKPENKDELTSLLIYHIVPGKYLSPNLKSRSYQTVNGKKLNVDVENGEIKVNGARVIKVDLLGPNGVIHEIDTVLVP